MARFPQSFIFGVGDSDIQVVGESYTLKEEGSQLTEWNHFAQHSGKCFHNDSPELAIDRYHSYKEDVALLKELNIRHYRTSVSMSRILHEDGTINKKAIEWYKTYFEELEKNGITIYVTLYHWELPYYLSKVGGWKNKKTIEIFQQHVKTVVMHLDQYVKEYFIINEPFCICFFGYHQGFNPPGEQNLKGSLEAIHNLLIAQGKAYEVIREINPKALISTVYNVQSIYSSTSEEKDVLAAQYADGYYNRWFLDPLYKGSYPQDMMELFKDILPEISKDDMKTIQIGNKLNALGVNYYSSPVVTYDENQEAKFALTPDPQEDKNDLDWSITLPPVYREGLYDTLLITYNRYKDYGLNKLYITENGIPLKSEEENKPLLEDNKRISFVSSHLKQVAEAIKVGVPMKGYFHWTLMDNYEWAYGYKPESAFGMIHVDRKTMKRTKKKSADWYKNVVSSKRLS